MMIAERALAALDSWVKPVAVEAGK